MAETYDIGVAPHCPLGPIAFAASLQIAFSTPNFVICEMSWKVSRRGLVQRVQRLIRPLAVCRCITMPVTLTCSPT
jgi:L-alanine-DL-glutamate epimerase-like enolase superfamily enzyme